MSPFLTIFLRINCSKIEGSGSNSEGEISGELVLSISIEIFFEGGHPNTLRFVWTPYVLTQEADIKNIGYFYVGMKTYLI